MRYSIELAPEAGQFFERIAETAGLPVEQVLADLLFRCAGELSVQALRAADHPTYPS